MKYTLNLTLEQYQEICYKLRGNNPTFQKYGIAGMAVSDQQFDSVESLLEAAKTPIEITINITERPEPAAF